MTSLLAAFLVMTSSLFIRGWQNERRTSFAMSKPAATAVIAFVTLLARLTLLPGVDAARERRCLEARMVSGVLRDDAIASSGVAEGGPAAFDAALGLRPNKPSRYLYGDRSVLERQFRSLDD